MKEQEKEQFSVITEQGDFGLGVDNLTEEENKKVKEQKEKKTK